MLLFRLLVAASALLSFQAFSADTKKKPKPLTVAELSKRTAQSLVTIDCLGDNSAKLATFQGFVVLDSGKILTSLTPLARCKGIVVKLANGDAYDSPTVNDTDLRRDLVILQIKAASLPALSLGDSNAIEVGQPV